eukprot:gene37199-45892_t
MGGGSINGGASTVSSSWCLMGVDGLFTTSRNYIFYYYDGTFTKMVQVYFAIVNGQLQVTGVAAGYVGGNQATSCLAVNTAWLIKNAASLATSMSSSDYGVKNIQMSYANVFDPTAAPTSTSSPSMVPSVVPSTVLPTQLSTAPRVGQVHLHKAMELKSSPR